MNKLRTGTEGRLNRDRLNEQSTAQIRSTKTMHRGASFGWLVGLLVGWSVSWLIRRSLGWSVGNSTTPRKIAKPGILFLLTVVLPLLSQLLRTTTAAATTAATSTTTTREVLLKRRQANEGTEIARRRYHRHHLAAGYREIPESNIR